MLEIQNTNEIATPWTAWFLYGPTGSGKTTAAASFPAPLFLVPANEGSELTLRGRGLPFVRIGKRADGKVVAARAHLSEILGDLEQRHARMRAHLAAGNHDAADDAFPWQTIVVESLTHLGDMLVEDVSNFGQRKMDQQGWGAISSFLRTLHSRLRGMDVHIVYTSLAKTQESEAGGITTGGPALIGSMAEKMPSACDVIAYMEELPAPKGEQPIHRAYFRKYRWWQARARFAGFPDYVDNFEFAQVQQHLGIT